MGALSSWISSFSRPGVRDFSQLTLDLTRNELIVGARLSEGGKLGISIPREGPASERPVPPRGDRLGAPLERLPQGRPGRHSPVPGAWVRSGLSRWSRPQIWHSGREGGVNCTAVLLHSREGESRSNVERMPRAGPVAASLSAGVTPVASLRRPDGESSFRSRHSVPPRAAELRSAPVGGPKPGINKTDFSSFGLTRASRAAPESKSMSTERGRRGRTCPGARQRGRACGTRTNKTAPSVRVLQRAALIPDLTACTSSCPPPDLQTSCYSLPPACMHACLHTIRVIVSASANTATGPGRAPAHLRNARPGAKHVHPGSRAAGPEGSLFNFSRAGRGPSAQKGNVALALFQPGESRPTAMVKVGG
ncbi:hypothetical protein P4O66_000778 [Electrophorus voltai]|uniref:Uncharacterized protein n=1 Tax=Electrophorus voltai TaxID=2609070 RepID=A0AAD8ZEI6_9TELE|nr:hypothetical protein P4O66_000778 [Electrophorus voltai]